MITPNRLPQAEKELSNVELGEFEIPTQIQEQGSKNHYHCICVRAKKGGDKFTQNNFLKVRVVDINQWNKMQRQIKSKHFDLEFGDIFDKVVILHNPTLPLAKEKPKDLSPKQKGQVNKMLEENPEADAKTIAEAIGVEVERVQAYINQ
jgi:hypothetical protein